MTGTTLPVYATQVTAYYLARDAAITASGSSGSPAAPFNFIAGNFAVGDGGGTVPALSTLIATGALVNEVWSGETISGVAQDTTSANQIDITCVVPDTQGGVEVGGFTIREFAVYDELGHLCVVGVTNIEKTLSTEGQINTIMLVVAIATASTNNVVITPPTANFMTQAQVDAEITALMPTANAPLTRTITVDTLSREHAAFGIVNASEPAADPPSAPQDLAALGAGRPATAGEFAAFAPTAGRFAWPWPTLQQLGALVTYLQGLISAIHIPGALTPLFLSGGNYQISAATNATVGVGRSATTTEATTGVTNTSVNGPAWITPEELAPAVAGAFPAHCVAAGLVSSGSLVFADGISSVTASSGGGFLLTFAFSHALPDTNYCVVLTLEGSTYAFEYAITRSTTQFVVNGPFGSAYLLHFAVFHS